VAQELRDEKSRHFKDWNHQLVHPGEKQELHLSTTIMQQIWYLILELQHRNLTPQYRHANAYESSPLWNAFQLIYKQLIAPLFPMNPDQFKQSKLLVEDVHHVL
jgi:hypothetical protein